MFFKDQTSKDFIKNDSFINYVDYLVNFEDDEPNIPPKVEEASMGEEDTQCDLDDCTIPFNYGNPEDNHVEGMGMMLKFLNRWLKKKI